MDGEIEIITNREVDERQQVKTLKNAANIEQVHHKSEESWKGRGKDEGWIMMTIGHN